MSVIDNAFELQDMKARGVKRFIITKLTNIEERMHTIDFPLMKLKYNIAYRRDGKQPFNCLWEVPEAYIFRKTVY